MQEVISPAALTWIILAILQIGVFFGLWFLYSKDAKIIPISSLVTTALDFLVGKIIYWNDPGQGDKFILVMFIILIGVTTVASAFLWTAAYLIKAAVDKDKLEREREASSSDELPRK